MHTDSHLTDRYVIESLQALMEDAARDLAVACLGRPATYVEDALGDYRSAADINPDAPLHMWLADPLVHTYLTGLLVGHLNVPYQPAADAANEVLDELQGQFNLSGMTRRQAAIVGAYTGILAGPFADLHQYAEELMERPVWTHEFGDKRFSAELKSKAASDFKKIAAVVTEGE